MALGLAVSTVPGGGEALARRQLEGHWQRCVGEDPDSAIAGCSVIIRSGAGGSGMLAKAYYDRAIAYRGKRQFRRAIADNSAAIRLNPDFTEAYIERGIARYEQRQFALAIADYDHAIRLRPNLAVAFNNRSLAYLKLAQYDLATRDFDQTIRLEKNYGNALINRSIGPILP